jgi:hypothetical protein
LGNIFSALSPLFIIFFCVKHPDGVLGRPDGDTDCPDSISGVRTIRLIRSDAHSSCPDDRVFATSTWHYVWTSLKFRPDGEPCRVKSHSPRAAAHFLVSFLCFFVVLCVFLVLFMHSSHVLVSSFHFISSPCMY